MDISPSYEWDMQHRHNPAPTCDDCKHPERTTPTEKERVWAAALGSDMNRMLDEAFAILHGGT